MSVVHSGKEHRFFFGATTQPFGQRAYNTRPRTFRRRFALGEPLFEYGRIVMEWFSKRTSIAGIQLPNWMVVLGAIIVIVIIYNSIH